MSELSRPRTEPRLGPIGALRRWSGSTFSSLRVRNYRLYFIGQGISLIGTWMQVVATPILILRLTNSAALLGVVVGLQFLPILLLAPYGGVLADRLSKRRLLLFTQSSAALLAFGLGTLVATGLIRVWMVILFAVGLGLVNAIDNPTRQSFVHELVGEETLRNAVTLYALEVNLTRTIGPAIAAVLVVAIGLAPCFFVNGVSFIAVLGCLLLMRGTALHPAPRVRAARGQIREGFAYVRTQPLILDVLVIMAIVGTLTYEFNVTMAVMAKYVFHDPDVGFALLLVTMGLGAVIGGLATAGRRTATIGGLTGASLGFGLTTIAVAISPTLAVALAGMVLVGAFSIVFTSLTNVIIQLEAASTMRGRVMSLWSMAFLGSTVIGAPVIGYIAAAASPRWALATGGIAALVAALVGLLAMRSGRHTTISEEPVEAPPMTEKEDRA